MSQEIVLATSIVVALVGVVWGQVNYRMRTYDKKFDMINGRCMIEVGVIATVSESIKNLDSRTTRIEDKLDELTLLVKKNGL